MSAIATPTEMAVRRRRSIQASTVALYVFLSVYSLFNILPLIWIVVSSTKSNTEIYASVFSLPKTWSVANYVRAFQTGDLVTALNSIGTTPRDLINILQAIKAAGALEAELEII